MIGSHTTIIDKLGNVPVTPYTAVLKWRFLDNNLDDVADGIFGNITAQSQPILASMVKQEAELLFMTSAAAMRRPSRAR